MDINTGDIASQQGDIGPTKNYVEPQASTSGIIIGECGGYTPHFNINTNEHHYTTNQHGGPK